MKKHIPNILTLANLSCGAIAIPYILNGDLQIGAYLIVLGGVFDFFDGLVARLLNVQGELGKQLDSLADMITFGITPGFIAHKLLLLNGASDLLASTAICIPIFSAYRLANFNIDTKQDTSFIGLPTPANGFFWASLIFVNWTVLEKTEVLVTLVLIMSFLLIAKIPMFSLKFKSFKPQENKMRYSFLLICLALIILFSFTAIPIIILLYIIFSIVNNLVFKST